MSLTQISQKKKYPPQTFALFDLGFRPFFLGAGFFSLLSIGLWTVVYAGQLQLITNPYTIFEWHAHEMVYGFSMAVIAGFLLTAIMNWTGIQTLRRLPLIFLFVTWATARILFSFGTEFLRGAALADLTFNIFLLFAVVSPIYQAKQWRQTGIAAKVLLLTTGNILFYLDGFQLLDQGAFYSVYGGLFLVVSLIMTIGGRVVPAFIRNALEESVQIKNPGWISVALLVLFLSFFINYLFIKNGTCIGATAMLLFLIHTYRLYLWHHRSIWRKPLLWGLYLAFVSISLGFFLFVLHGFYGFSPFPALHAFAYGAVGLSIFSMMIRVTLGHTGRTVNSNIPNLLLPLSSLVVGTVIRTVAPFFFPGHYAVLIFVSQLLWLMAFSGYLLLFGRMLLYSRVDGQPG